MKGVLKANSLVDWLEEKIKDPKTHEWGWDRIPFFGDRSKMRGEVHPRWQKRVDEIKPKLESLVASRGRKGFEAAGSAKIAVDIHHGTKRRAGEIEEEEEEEAEPSKWEIWSDQVEMRRKYLTDNHKQMRMQGVDLPYFSIYRTYGW